MLTKEGKSVIIGLEANIYEYKIAIRKRREPMNRYDVILQKLEFIKNNKGILEPVVIEKLEEGFDLDFTYNSTTIEGNTLTKMEMKLLIEDNVSIGGKELREIYEVTNHKKAYDYVKDCIIDGTVLDEAKLKDIHEILTENIFKRRGI